MLTNTGITIYHLNGDDKYERRYYLNAYMFTACGTKSDESGQFSGNICKIRIPTGESIQIAVGDYVFAGCSELIVPDKEKCFAVLGFTDNRTGANPHWKIIAG